MRATGASLRFIGNGHCLLVCIVKVLRLEFSIRSICESLIANGVTEGTPLSLRHHAAQLCVSCDVQER